MGDAMVSALVLTAFIKLLFITDCSRFVAGLYIGMMVLFR
jgi:hypothetical protein